MDNWALAIGLVSLSVSPVYGYVGNRLRLRPVPAHAQLASAQFTAWWWGLGASTAVSGVEGILWSFHALSLPLAVTFLTFSGILDCVFLWGLLGYLTYLYTGRNLLLEWSVFYSIFFLAFVYYVNAVDPIGVAAKNGIPSVTFAVSPFNAGPVVIFVVIGLVVPELAGIVLYFSLIRRTSDRTLRYRIALVTLSLAVFFGISFYTPPGNLISPLAWNLARALIEAGSSLICLIAYLPPAGVRRWLRIDPIAGPEGASGKTRQAPRAAG
ncbi:MAG TPA: hypothetical protein VGX00_01680 [Thermoplasmata archaeon]|nr:hypothetical protein [Thermoplasmata archaeon]